ncbi:hypothetical protein [Paenibacillus sp. NPDC057967]|uniref:hypothetical protein n=1 Tax=Paenibacillus sp. NPDC057967 TaxID=3346293 RepID=UPI0036D8889D
MDTAIYDNGYAIGLHKPKINETVKQRKMMSPEAFAAFALKGLSKNKPIICPIPMRKTMEVFFHLFPAAHRKLMRLVCRVVREAQVT